MSLPSTYNLLIGASTSETLYYARCALFTLQEFTEYSPGNDDTDLGNASTVGLHYLLHCINEAIRFETEWKI